MTVKLLTEHNLEFLSLKGGCTSSSESTPVKMAHCLKSRVTAQICMHSYLVNSARTFQLLPCIVCGNRGSYMSAHVLLNLLNEFR